VPASFRKPDNHVADEVAVDARDRGGEPHASSGADDSQRLDALGQLEVSVAVGEVAVVVLVHAVELRRDELGRQSDGE
jgi:hypothetical protein